MQDLVYRRVKASNTVDHLGTVTANAADAAMTHATYTSNWKDLADVAGIPFDGMDLLIQFGATGFTSTGATGTASLVIQHDTADSATVGTTTGTVVQTTTGRAIVATFATSASAGFALDSVTYPAPTTFKLPLPEIRHRYGRVVMTTTLGTITGANYGVVGASLEPKGTTKSVISIG